MLLKKVIGLSSAIVILFLALVLTPLPENSIKGKVGDFVLRNVSVIDVKSGVAQHHKDVILSEGHILDIMDHNDLATFPNITLIEAAGKFLIPGLWDMHTHSWKLSPQLHHPLFIANGVTSVRDLSGCLNRNDRFWACPQDRSDWNAQMLGARRVSPQYVQQSSYQTNGGNEVPGGFPEFFRLADSDAARQLIEFYKAQGVVSIKPYTELTLEQYSALATAARTQGLRLAGHRPIAVSLEQTLAHQQASIEHARLFLFECKNDAQLFRNRTDPISAFNADFMSASISNRNSAECDQLMHRMANSDTWWTPTLTTLAMGAFSNDEQFLSDQRLRLIPWMIRKVLWQPDINRAKRRGYDSKGSFAPLSFFKQAQADVARAEELGIKLLAGTDSTDTYVFSGSSLHDEMEMMSAGGMTPAATLRTATYNAALFSGLADHTGTIASNMDADLVLLNKNPLLDIRNTREIEAVFLNGAYYDHATLQKLRAYTREMAGSLRLNLVFLWNMLASPLWRVQLID